MTTKHPTTIVELSDGLVDITTDDHRLVLVYDTPVKRDEARRLFLRGLVERLTDDQLEKAAHNDKAVIREGALAEQTYRFRLRTRHMTEAQVNALRGLCQRYLVAFDPEHYSTAFDLPEGWVNGWIGGPNERKLFVGVSPEGEVHS